MLLASKLKPKNPEAQKLHFRYYRLKVPMVRVRNLGCLDCSKGRARHQNHVTWDADRKSTETLGSSYYSCPQGFVGIVDGRSQSSATPFNQTLNPKPYSRRDSSDGRRKKALKESKPYGQPPGLQHLLSECGRAHSGGDVMPSSQRQGIRGSRMTI